MLCFEYYVISNIDYRSFNKMLALKFNLISTFYLVVDSTAQWKDENLSPLTQRQDDSCTYMPPTASRWHHTCFLEVWTLAGCSSSRSRCGRRHHPGIPHVHAAGSVPSCLPSPFSQTQEGGHLWWHGQSQNHSPGRSGCQPYQDPVGEETHITVAKYNLI